MKRLRLAIIVSILLASTLFTGCGEHSEDYLQNIIFISNRYEGAKLHNGDKIPIRYYCEFATEAEVTLSALDYGHTFFRQTYKMKRGDGGFDIYLNVEDHTGMVVLNISYCYASEQDMLETTTQSTHKRLNIEIVAPEEPTSWGDDSNIYNN